MEVFLYNSNVCRLCGEENDNGTLLYSDEENNQNLCEIINAYLPIKVSDDGELPRTICPGCTIQLEATVEFLNLIINGQKVIRELYEREREYRKSLLKTKDEPDVITEKIVYEINTSDGVYQVEHPISLQVAGLEKPKRKRGRPPKKSKTPEEIAAESAAKEQQAKKQTVVKTKEETLAGKRRRKTPTRFKEVVQGAELERILKEEGVTDGEESEPEPRRAAARAPEVIGHLEAGGELVLVVRGKGRGRPKGRMQQTREQCVICGMEFSCIGRYMSHVAQHGPVLYRCSCEEEFTKRLHFNDHQRDTGHTGLTVIQVSEKENKKDVKSNETDPTPVAKEPDRAPDLPADTTEDVEVVSLPDLTVKEEPRQELVVVDDDQPADSQEVVPATNDSTNKDPLEDTDGAVETTPAGKKKLKCNHCDKLFSSKQSKSLHTKAVHKGEKPYTCGECGAAFAYPRSLALHAVAHRRRAAPARGFACDLCGKVLNHPSSVVYHKQAVHAAQRYICGACGKRFRHKQLLQRHQLVHSQLRPFSCKVCTATFKTKTNLLNHQLLHSGVKKFTCEICKHKFSHKTSLTLHMRWHSGVKPFQCGVCGKSFSQKGNLSEHARIHTGEKPYACALCPRRFTTSSQHRLHTRRHARVRSSAARREAGGAHRCGACGGVFASRWALAQHARAAQHHAKRKQNQKQVSLLVPDKSQQVEQPDPAPADDSEERVIYVAYDIDDTDSPAFHILDPEQAVDLEESKVLTSCELYSGSSLLVSQQLEMGAQLERLAAPVERLEIDGDQLERRVALERQLGLERHGELGRQLALGQRHGDVRHDEEVQQVHVEEFEQAQHLPVTDEQGNPLHFTMQDGTRLAITSSDGKSLQVITQDGQTIPVEINGFSDEEELDTDTVVHQLDIQNSAEPVTHYFTLV